MKEIMRSTLCLLLVLCMVLALPVTAQAATPLPDSIYLTQEGYSTCTLCSAAMMLRARLYLSGHSGWSTVTESSLRPVAWGNGVGLKWLFTYELEDASVTVSHASTSGITVDGLNALLEAHPEGIVLYCGNLPHAVFVTDYEDGVFYCAEPVAYYGGGRMPLVESYLGEYGSQENILARVTAYWYVSDYSISGTQGSAPECACSEDYAGTYICDVSADSVLNIRSGHGTGYSVIGSIPSGAEVTVTKASGAGNSDWAHVEYNGIRGYVSMQFLDRKEPEAIPAETYTVTYDANGGTGAPEAQTKTQGEPLTLSEKEPTREGWRFAGWADSIDATEAAYQPGGSYTADGDATLYAVWEEIVTAPEETPAVATTPMYRLYNPNSGEHFYTGSTVERDMLSDAGWNYEGVAWNAPIKSGDPVYRLYNPNSGDHHYTMGAGERDWLVSLGWQYEGVAWNSAADSEIPLFRLYNPNADCGSHHYTSSTEERDWLIGLGWIDEGIGWYGTLK